jgi:hypothetical protein
MGFKRVGLIVTALAVGMMVAVAPTVEAKSGKAVLTARLTAGQGFAGAKGKATFKAQQSKQSAGTSKGRGRGSDDGGACTTQPCGEQELEVEVEHLRGLAGSNLNVLVDGTLVGTMTVSSLGQAELHLNSRSGQSVPAVHTGSTVEITTQANARVASGTF